MSKKYLRKVNSILLEKKYKNSLSILLEEDEEDTSGDDSKNKDNDSQDKDDSDVDFSFPSDSNDNESEEDDDIDDVIGDSNIESSDDSDIEVKDQENKSISTQDLGQMSDIIDNAISDLDRELSDVADKVSSALLPDDNAEAILDSEYYDDEYEYYGDESEYYGDEPEYYGDEPEYYGDESEYYDDEPEYYGDVNLTNQLAAGYQRKSIKNFISEVKEDSDKVKQKKFDDIEAQIEKLEYLTDLLDSKFNRKTNVIDENDLEDIVSKSIELINHHDPVAYAYNETIKYINVKGERKIKDRLIEDFKLMFNERCSKEGYDTSSITGISSIEPTKFKTSVVGGES